MKKIFLCSFFLIMALTVTSQTFNGSEARSLIPGTDMIVKDTLLDIPTFIRFSKGSEPAFKDLRA